MRELFSVSALITGILSLAGTAGSTTLPGEVAPGYPAGTSLANPVCTAAECDIIEGILITLPFGAIAGDVVLLDPDGSISDIVRFFNNLVDTGGGTGFGNQVFMYSRIDGPGDLSPNPDTGLPPTLSVNAVRIPEAPEGFPTNYNGNGRLYHFYSDVVPEPSTAGLSGISLALLTGCGLWFRRGSREL